MDGLTISELDEASIRIFSLQCAMMVLESEGEPITASGFIDKAMEFEEYINGGGTIHVLFSKDTTPKASGA